MPNLPYISPELLSQYQREISSQASRATAKRKTASLKQFLGWAHKEGYVQENLADKLSAPPSYAMPPSPASTPQKKYSSRLILGFGILAMSIILLFLLVKKLKLPVPFRPAPASEITTITKTPVPTPVAEKPIDTSSIIAEIKQEAIKIVQQTLEWASFEEGNLKIGGAPVSSLLLSTGDTTDGDITINPDGSGIAHFLFEGTGQNFLNAQAPNLTSGSLYYGIVANNATGYDLIRLQNGSKPITRFNVDAKGNTYAAGDLNVAGDIQTSGIDRLSSTGALTNITGYTQTSGNFTITQNAGDFASISKKATALSDLLTLTLDERDLPMSTYSTLTLHRYNGAIEAMALLVDDGNAQFDGQLRLGRFATNPATIGTGSLVYNSTDNKVYFWNGTVWTEVGAGGTTPFSSITSGTNTVAAMIVGSGASLTYSGTGTINATTLNSIADTSFLRSDTSDNFTSGTLTTDAGTTLDLNGELAVADTNILFDGATTQFTTTGDLTIDSGGGQVLLSNGDTLNIGGLTGVTYNAFADATDTKDEAAVAADNDVYIGGDLEVDGTIYGTVTASDLSCTDCVDASDLADTLDFDTATETSLTLLANNATATSVFTLTTDGLTSGIGTTFDLTNTTVSTAFTGDLTRVNLAQTYTGGVGLNTTGNLVDIARSISLDNLGNTLTVSGAVATISDTASVTQGTLTHSADVLRIAQNYTSNTGAALNVTSGGDVTGFAFRVNDDGTFTDSTPFVIDNTGKVGIGTAAPAVQELTVDGGTRFRDATATRYRSDYTISSSGLNINAFDDTGGVYIPVRIDGFSFAMRADASDAKSLTLANDGNVGIADTSADAKLEVLSTTEQLRLTNVDGTTDARFTVSATGDLTVDMLGSGTTDQFVLADTDTINIGGSVSTDVAYNLIATVGDVADEAAIAADNDLYIGGDLEVDGTIYGTVTATNMPWSGLTSPTTDLTLAMDADTTTFNWTATGALNPWTMNLTNNAGSATIQNFVTINNAANASAPTDILTENLLLVQQLDTATGNFIAVDNAVKIDSAGAAGITDAIEITNSAGNISNGINLVDTVGGTFATGVNFSGTFTNEISLRNAETVSNAADGTITLGANSGDATLSLSGTAATISNTAGNLTIDSFANLVLADTSIQLTGSSPIIDLTSATTLSLNTTTNRPITTGTGLLTTGGNVTVNGGSLLTNQSTFNLINTTATTINFGEAATTLLSIGSTTTGLNKFWTDVDFALTGSENLSATSTITTDVANNVLSVALNHNVADTTAQRVLFLQLNDDGAVAAGTIEALAYLNNADPNETISDAIVITADGASGTGGFTTGLDFDDTDIVTDIELQNDETMSNDTNGTIALAANSGVVTLSLSGTAATLSNTAGNLTINSASNLDIDDAVIDVSTQATDIEIIDGSATALTISQATNNYITVDTTDTLENLILSAGTSGTTRHVRIGATSASSTPDLLVLDQKNTAGDPTGALGAIYINNSGKFMVYEGGTPAWKEVCNKTDQACGTGTGSAWSALTNPIANLTLEHTSAGTGYTTTFNWTDTTNNASFFTLNLDNNGGTAGNDYLFNLVNTASTNTTGDLNTEALLFLDNADTSGTGSTIVDNAILITNSGGISSGIVDAIDATDSNIDNALNAGTNNIAITTGTIGSNAATTIDFAEFDVSSGTGAITINDDGNLGLVSVEGSTFDINSLDFVVAGTITTAASNDLTLNPGDEVVLGDTDTLIVGGHAGNVDYNVFSNAGGSPTNPNVTVDNDIYVPGDIDVGGTIYVGGSQFFSYWTLSSSALYPNLNTYNAGVGTVTAGDVISKLYVTNASSTLTGKAVAIFNQTEAQDIITASASSTPRMTVTNAGNIVLHQAATIQSLNYASGLDDTLTLRGNIVKIQANAGQEVISASPGEVAINDPSNSTDFRVEGDNDANLLITDASADKVGIGDSTPDAKLEVLATTEQLRLTNVDDTTDARFTVSSTGDLTIDMLGSGTTDQLVLADTDTINIGGSGSTEVAYNVIGDTTAGASASMNSDDDLYIEGDLEVDGTIFGTVVGTVAWNNLTAPTGNLTLAHTDFTTSFSWDTATDAARDYFSMAITNDLVTDTTTQRLLVLSQANDAIGTGTTETLLALENNDANEAVTNGILFGAGGAATPDFTNGINFDAADFTTEIILENAETIANQTDGTITLGADSGAAVTLSLSGTAGTLSNTAGNLTINAASNLVLADATIQLTGGTTVTMDLFNASTTTLSILNSTGGIVADVSIEGDLTVQGGDINGLSGENIDLGETTADTIVFYIQTAGELSLNASALFPTTDSGLDLGSATNQFADLYLDGGNINLLAATDIDIPDATSASLTISEGTSNYFQINTTNNSETVTLNLPVAGTTLTGNLFTSNNGKTINIGTGSGVDLINIGTGAGPDTITMGNTAAATAININSNQSAQDIVTITGRTLTTGNFISMGSELNRTAHAFSDSDQIFTGQVDIAPIASIVDTFVYDTTQDSDGGSWRTDEKSRTSSWYNETIDSSSESCNIAVHDRCGSKEFPEKAIIVATPSNVYIYDAKENTMWMKFSQGTDFALDVDLNNNPSSFWALNGKVYIGTNGSAATGLYSVDFKADKITKYNTTDARDFTDNVDGRNADPGTPYMAQARTSLAIVDATINDVHAAQINGKVYIAAGTDAGSSVINEVDATVRDYDDEATAVDEDINSIWLDKDGNLWALNETAQQLEKWNLVINDTTDENPGNPDTRWDETTTPALFATAQTINIAPSALFLKDGVSSVDGKSQIVYVGHNAGLTAINAKSGDETNGSVKYFNKDFISEEMLGDIRNMMPFAGAATLAVNTTLGSTDSDVSVKQNAWTTSGATNQPTSASGAIRGTGLDFDGTDDYVCTGTTGTCADDADLDPAGTLLSFGGWFRRDANTADADVVIAKWGNGTADQVYKIQIETGDTITLSTRTSATVSSSSPPATGYTDTTYWHFVVGTYDGTNQRLYMDGVLVATDAQTGSLTNGGVAATVGADLSGASNVSANFFNGDIDETFVTAETLTPGQIRKMFEIGVRARENHTASRIEGVTGTDDFQRLLGNGASGGISSTSRVFAVGVDNFNQFALVGTNDATTNEGGVTVIGIDSDTAVDLYDATNNTSKTDDVATPFAASDVVSLSISGNLCASFYNNGSSSCGSKATLSIAGTNDTTTTDWMETTNSSIYSTLATLTSPDMVKNEITVNNVFQVFNTYNNLASTTTGETIQTPAFIVDQHGQLTLNTASTVTGTAATFNNEGSGNSFLVNDATSDTTPFVIDASGNVGIGLTTPLSVLHVARDDSSTNTEIELARLQRTTSGTAAAGIGAYTSTYVEDGSGTLFEAGRVGFSATNVTTGAASAAAFKVYTERETSTDMFSAFAAYVTSADRLLCMNGTDGAVSGWDCFGMTIGSANAVSLNFDGTSRMKLDYASGTSTVTFFASNTSDQLQIETLGSQPIYLDTRGTGDGADVYLATTGFLGIATTGPDRKLDVLDSTNPQIRLTQADGTVYTDLKTDASGDLTITPSGGDIFFSDGTNTLAAVKDQGDYVFWNLKGKTDTGNPATCAEGDIYYNAFDNTVYVCHETNTWEQMDGAGGGSSVWSALTDPAGNLSLSMAAWTTTFTWNAATGANNLFNFTDTLNNTGTGYLVNITTASGSTLKPFHVSAAGTEAIVVDATGNVGIGTASPSPYRLYASNNPSNFVARISNTNTAAGSDGLVVTTAATDSGSEIAKFMYNGTASTAMVILADGNVGIGDTTPSVQLNVGTADTTHGLGASDALISDALEVDGVLYLDGKNLANPQGTNFLTLCIAGGVACATTSEIEHTLTNGSWTIQNPSGGNVGKAALIVVQNMGGDIFTASAGATTKFTIANNGNVTISGSGTMLTVGGGTGKIDVGTVDPVYSIGDNKFATYMAGMVGVKEETTGNITTSQYIPGVGYRTVIDFKQEAEGSDLWLFSRTTDIKNNIDKMVVLLSPSDNTRTWYEVDEANYTLSIYSSRPTVVSYRLTAPRFDYAQWTNANTNPEATGFQVENVPLVGTGQEANPEAPKLSDFEIVKTISDTAYKVFQTISDGSQIAVEEFGAFSNLVAGNVKAGAIEAKDITANAFTAFQGNIDTLLINRGLVSPVVQTKLISPIADETDVKVQIGQANDDGTSGFGQLVIQDATGSAVASIDTQGNATFSGTLEADKIKTNDVIAGKIYADEIVARNGFFTETNTASVSGITREEIEKILREVEQDQNILAQASTWNISTATDSANLEELAVSNLYVTDQAAINTLSVTNSIALGPDLVLQSKLNEQNLTVNSLDTLSAPLSIQSLALAPVEIMAGKVRVDTNGDVIISGNLFVAGKIESSGLTLKDTSGFGELLNLEDGNGNQVGSISATGSAQFSSVATDRLVIAGAEVTPKVPDINQEIQTNATAGSAVIPAGITEITIRNPNISDYTLVYITPTSSTQNNALYVKAKAAGFFTVGFSDPIGLDVTFNWWVIDVHE